MLCRRMQQLPTLLAQQCWELLRPCWQWCANGCNKSRQYWDLQCIVGRIQPIRPLETMCHARSWPQQCWKSFSCTNGSNIVALRFNDHGTKEMLGVMGSNVWPVSNFALQRPTTCNRVCKRTQHVTSNNREFTRRQRWQQREWQKNNGFRH